jgi:PEGA domain
MRNPAASFLLSCLLFSFTANAQEPGPLQNPPPPAQQPPTQQAPAQQPAATQNPSSKFVLQDGTPIKLRLCRNVSSADATVGESVDFEVLEEVVVDGVTIVPKGGTAIGSVTEAVPKRRMGRAGKLEIVMDYVRLADKEKAAVRAVKDAKGGSHTTGMTVGIVATGIFFWPAAPLFLLMHGKDITVPKGAEITAYVNGDQKLVAANFLAPGDSMVPLSAPASATSAPPADSVVPNTNPSGSFQLQSDPPAAEVFVDCSFVGNTPATLKLKPGQHTVRVTLDGYKEWSRDLTVQEGSDAHLQANLQKLE